MNCEACGHPNIEGARFCAKCGGLLPVQDQATEDKLIGQIVGGRYRITGVLGEGGMGVVYVGEQQMGSTLRQVAIKTLHPHLSQDPSVRARFNRECGTVAQLEHPNTIKFYDFGSTADGTLYIAMEYVKGKALSDIIEKEGPMIPERTLKIMKQVCGALDEAHKQGIIHRDLKPENIILTNRAGETDFVKVLDFGIAARSESADAQKEQKLTQQGMVLGTPPYMSPEQFTGKALDLRSDIYSLGVMTYEMLTGKLPFEAETPWQWATQHMTAQPLPFEVTAPATSIPDHMRKGILRALSKNREERHESAKDFYADISRGGGITVMEAPREQVAVQGTAAMAAAPDFGTFGAPAAAPPPVAATAPGVPSPAPGVPSPAPMPMVVPAHVPPPPVASRGGGGGGKGLLIGLGAVGFLLLIGLVIVGVTQMRKKDDGGDQALTNPLTSNTGATTIAPIETGGGGTTPSGTETAATETVSTTKPPSTKPTTTGTGTGTGKPPVSDAASCDACISAAQSGAIQAAAGAYRRCNDAAKKAQCSMRAKASSQQAVNSAALNGNCAQAKAIAAAAASMGASPTVPAKCK